MRWITIGIVCVLAIPLVSAEEYEITPRYFDLTPGDGLFDAGSVLNPWVIEGPEGEIASLHPKYHAFGDSPWFAPGSALNPWVVETPDE